MIQTPDAISIRHGVATDNFLLAELGALAFAAAFAAENTPEDMAAYLAEHFGPDQQAAELADPATTFLIAEQGGEAIGYARLKRGPAPDCIRGEQPIEIVRFYAHPQRIGRGIGAALMRACLELAASQGCDVVWLDVWERNQRAIVFYEKWGFAVVGEQDFQLGDDLQHDLLMARKNL